jgi:hypothetical protein
MTTNATNRAIRRMLDADISIDSIIAGLEVNCDHNEAVGAVLSALESEEQENIELEKRQEAEKAAKAVKVAAAPEA